ATARLLAAKGANVVLGARRGERLARIAADIRKAGGSAEYLAVDVTQRKEAGALVKHAQEKFGCVDVMFNNAGVMLLAPLQELKTSESQRMIDINIEGVLTRIAAVWAVRGAQASGHIIPTAATAAYWVGPRCGVYCATKYAVRAIPEGLRQETYKIR